jgi:hypothetical protein
LKRWKNSCNASRRLTLERIGGGGDGDDDDEEEELNLPSNFYCTAPVPKLIFIYLQNLTSP